MPGSRDVHPSAIDRCAEEHGWLSCRTLRFGIITLRCAKMDDRPYDALDEHAASAETQPGVLNVPEPAPEESEESEESEEWWRIRSWILPELAVIHSAEQRRRLWREIQGEVAYLFVACALGIPVLVWAGIAGWEKLGGPTPVHAVLAALLSLPFAFWLPFLIRRGHLRGIVLDRLSELSADPRCMSCGQKLTGTDRVRCSECGWVVPRPLK